MMKKSLILFILVFLLAIPSPATDYYVDATDGSDANTGLSTGQAWQTITEVNSNMGSFSPGDSILFQREETWVTGALYITCSGSSSGDITFGAYGAGNRPDFNGVYIYDDYSGASYITVENINVRNVTAGTSIYFSGTARSNITIRNCDVSNGRTNGIYIDQTDTYLIDNCDVSNCLNGHIIIYGSPSNQITDGIVSNCDIVGADSNEDGICFHTDGDGNHIGPNHYIYNCTATNCGEQGFDFDSANNMIIRDCVAHDQTAHIGSTSFGYSTRAYFENFFSYNERDEGLVFASLPGSEYLVVINSKFYNDGGENIYLGDIGASHIYLLNNTFVGAGDDVVRIHEDTDTLIVKNNIMDAGVRWLNYQGAGTANSTNTTSDYNLFYAFGDGFYDATEGAMNLTEWQSAYSQDMNSQYDDPLLTNPAVHNFELQQGSPCINAGGWITTITSANGSGTSFVVEDSNPFHDGFGLTTGSEIQLEGDLTSVLVTDVNYITNAIMVDEVVSWIQGDGVAFAHNGYAPDIGAEESGSEQPPPQGIEKSITITLIIEEKPPPILVPDFDPASDPTSQIVEQEQSASYTISIVPIDGFDHPVSLSIAGLPTSVTAIFTPQTIIPSETSTLELTVGTGAEVGAYDLIITAKEVIQ